MANDSKDLTALLKNLRLFVGLDDAQLELVAAATKVIELSEGQFLSLPANRDYPFFLIITGKVKQIRQLGNGKLEQRLLKREDFFGAEIPLTGRESNYRIQALERTTLLKVESQKFNILTKNIYTLHSNVQYQLYIYRLIRSKIFNWLGEGETVYLIMRKHTAALFVTLLKPLFLAWIALFIFLFSISSDAGSLQSAAGWVSLGLGAAIALWVLWLVLDWLNDYYVITDRRVVFLHRVILLYESRVEAPITAVKSEEVKISLLGRMLGYGDVITFAFLGQVVFKNIPDPHSVREVIGGLRMRTAASQMKVDSQTMESMIRQKINPHPVPQPTPSELAPVQNNYSGQRHVQHGVPLLTQIHQFFRAYIVDESGIITYRKHILILVKRTWIPAMIILLTFTAAIYIFYQRMFGDWTFPSLPHMILIPLAIILLSSLWWLYQYVDWQNDVYQITDDKIIDSEKKPLGTETTKSAPLENILSLDYELIGFWGVLFNLGNVIINTGTDKLTWMTITDPARAQREIFNRMFEQRRRKKVSDARKEWDQVSDWLAAYHRQSENLRRMRNQPPL